MIANFCTYSFARACPACIVLVLNFIANCSEAILLSTKVLKDATFNFIFAKNYDT